MDPMATTGLLYLCSGALIFTILLFVLREIGLRGQPKDQNNNSEEDKWVGKDVLNIVDIKEETHDIKTFRLQRKNGGFFPEFNEGQFISFQIGNPDDKNLRSYSISSSNINLKTVDVSIKLLKDGLGSGWFHSRKIGDEVTAYSPNGLFTTKEAKFAIEPLVFVAGGIGITPFLSMLKTATDLAVNTPIYLFYGARTTNDLAFHSEIDLMAKRFTNINYIPVLSEQKEQWEGQSGYISFDLISSVVKNWNSAKYYFCGPPILTDSVSEKLFANNISEEQIHSEKFASPVSMDLSKVATVQAKISLNGTEYSYDGKQTLLEFFEEKGENISYACRVGVCGSCKCKLTEGSADAFSDSGLTREEIKQGYIQTCVARPLGDIKLEG